VGTTFIGGIAEKPSFRTDFAQNSAASRQKMRFPVIIKHRRFEAVIYANSQTIQITDWLPIGGNAVAAGKRFPLAWPKFCHVIH
jgi:hypothetical protein